MHQFLSLSVIIFPDDLKRHIFTKQSGKFFQCCLCFRCLNTSYELTSHINKKHKGIVTYMYSTGQGCSFQQPSEPLPHSVVTARVPSIRENQGNSGKIFPSGKSESHGIQIELRNLLATLHCIASIISILLEPVHSLLAKKYVDEKGLFVYYRRGRLKSPKIQTFFIGPCIDSCATSIFDSSLLVQEIGEIPDNKWTM